MSSLPILLKKPQMLLIGGGKVAYRKARVLIDNQVEFNVVAKNFLDEFDTIDTEKSRKRFEINDLSGYDIVVDATGDPLVAQAIVEERKKRHLLINFTANPELSDFFFPALLNYGMLKIAVSTEGGSPTIGKVVRDEIKSFIPESINAVIQSADRDRKDGAIDPEKSRQKALKLFQDEKDDF